MKPLIINQEIVQQLKDLADYADKNRYTMNDLVDIQAGRQAPPGDRKEFVCNIPMGYRVVFTIEDHKTLYRHLSMSVYKPGTLPHPAAIEEVMGHLGFTRKLLECHKRIEEFEGGYKAINVLETIP